MPRRSDGHAQFPATGALQLRRIALADVGIAMGTAGSDVAVETADVAPASDDLKNVGLVINISRQTMSVIKQNYGLALGTNSIGLYLAAIGSINPIIAITACHGGPEVKRYFIRNDGKYSHTVLKLYWHLHIT